MIADDQLTSEQSAILLRERAAELAKVADDDQQTDGLLEVACFLLGDETVAVPTDCVIELLTLDSVTPIPQASKHFVGITNLRGTVTAIVDLCQLMGIPRDRSFRHQALVLGRDEPEFGILVDGVDHVVSLRPDDLVASAITNHPELVLGISPDGLLVFDGKQLLTCPMLMIDEVD